MCYNPPVYLTSLESFMNTLSKPIYAVYTALFLCLMQFSFADTYVKTHKESNTSKHPPSKFDTMRSVPTVNAEGRKPMLKSLQFEQQIQSAQNKNPNKGLLIDARKGKVVGAVSLSQQKDIARHSPRLQANKKQSRVQSLSPQIPIAPYQMQEERIDLQR